MAATVPATSPRRLRRKHANYGMPEGELAGGLGPWLVVPVIQLRRSHAIGVARAPRARVQASAAAMALGSEM